MNNQQIKQDQKRFLNILLECGKLRYKKFKQYGDCYKDFGVLGITLRLNDKINRIKNYYENQHKNPLITNEIEKSDESIKDTLKDICNYSIMGLMILENELNEIQQKYSEDIPIPEFNEILKEIQNESN